MTIPMHVLVTGSSGRIGSAICAELASRHTVRGLDRVPGRYTSVLGDFTEQPVLSRALEGIDAVMHVAALHAPHVGQVPDAVFRRINVDGVRALVDACGRRGIGTLVFTSTTALYGHASTPRGRAGWVDEDLVPQPKTIYHRTKHEAEQLLREAAGQGGPAVRIMRMSRCFPEPLPEMAVYRLHRGIDARDVATGHVAALTAGGLANTETFILSGTTPFERADCEALWNDAGGVLRHRVPALATAFEQRGWPLPSRIDRVYDPSRARQRLGWQARFGFESVLAQDRQSDR